LSLFKIDVETGVESEIYTNPELAIDQPAISPNGQYIAFVAYPANNPESSQGLYVLEINPETGFPVNTINDLEPLTTRSFLTYPVWDSSSETIYFQTLDRDTASGDFVGKIFAIGLDGENERVIPTGIRVNRGPVIGLIEVTTSP
jgi:Tol biopolymer transport system component